MIVVLTILVVVLMVSQAALILRCYEMSLEIASLKRFVNPKVRESILENISKEMERNEHDIGTILRTTSGASGCISTQLRVVNAQTGKRQAERREECAKAVDLGNCDGVYKEPSQSTVDGTHAS